MKIYLSVILFNIVIVVSKTLPEDWNTIINDGCSNEMHFASNFETESGEVCTTCETCEGSRIEHLFDPAKKSFCIDCGSAANECNTFRLVTTFSKSWIMNFLQIMSSDKSADEDPAKVTLFGSNDDVNWTMLFSSKDSLTSLFTSRNLKETYAFNNDKEYSRYSVQFVRKNPSTTMQLGPYGIVQAYTKKCSARFIKGIAGIDIVPYMPITAFYGAELKIVSDDKCMFYDSNGGMYSGNCDGSQKTKFDYNLVTGEIKATGGSRQGHCLLAEQWFWPKMRTCDGTEKQKMEFTDGKIKTTANNKCLTFNDAATRLIFEECVASGNEIFQIKV